MVSTPAPTPLWLALQPVANARLMLFEVERPNAREPQPIRRHVLDCFLKFDQIVGSRDNGPLVDTGDVAYGGYLCRAATLPLTTTNPWDWLDAQQDWSTPGLREGLPLPWDPDRLGTVVAPCDGTIWLGPLAQLQTPGVLPNNPRAHFAGCSVLHFGAAYGPGGIGLLTQPLLGERISLVLKPHRVLLLRTGDTLNLIAERYGTTVQTLRRINPALATTETIVTVEGDTLSLLAGRHGTTVDYLRQLNPSLLRDEGHTVVLGDTLKTVAEQYDTTVTTLRNYNPDYDRWPQHDPLPVGVVLDVLAIRPSSLLDPGQSLLVPAYRPSTLLPLGAWIYLPERRASAVAENAWDLDLTPEPSTP
ncbi:LysM peptidoglycan-binding domain-containing protein [Synechococcus sp. Cruz-9H2]|uniref:LysM peptidoglycan-binding domain-containing protein n=1 Tax=unclassified Synechococcus TaxID=2626047 RepID=UPI0020CF67DF|nr:MULTISPECIES: LysM domain-containing protein [unclassified Synechococcus]MCP9819851.1 LysM peptidoglycan-binding domain-containing protein [Synechococcus sp. Cruz-9H2]MCP9844083.1 LysM peptidoglycan-binding domain-containing protein [Synechococcus sp. Edmonson 11F2]MCP9856281.1 LysM peptidoglycan-binding domain-containing protein [Synechococcus sp. Cruz-9C9]MCP9863566.1 LysM peptidoglycan-binding domain-containing protein [Synechococcus sp. Cruz-7E5]MCP9870762.1 LysM peptidoglycan-binding d